MQDLRPARESSIANRVVMLAAGAAGIWIMPIVLFAAVDTLYWQQYWKILLGPLVVLLLVVGATLHAFAFMAPVVAAGGIAALAVIQAFRRWRRLALGLFLAPFAALCVGWITADLTAEGWMRLRAAQQFPDGYEYSRYSVRSLLNRATFLVPHFPQGDPPVLPYATLTAGGEYYLWSYRTLSWHPR